MKRPIWFRRHGLHWTPCAWQGWAIVAGLTLFILSVVFFWAPGAPIAAALATLGVTVLVVGVAAFTDDTHQPAA